MIEAHVGLPGSGKSLHAVARLLAAKKKGRRTLANFHSQTGMWEFGLWLDIAEAGNCLAVIDEAHMWFSARSWTKTEQEQLSYFQQHRKEGVDLVWVAQHEARVDVAIRELTAFIWRHRRFGRFCLASKVTPDEPKAVLQRKLMMIRKELFQHYFTEERIGFRDGSGYGFGTGAEYARKGGAAPVLDGTCRLQPNYFRVEFPWGIEYKAVNAPSLREVVAFALSEWRRLGFQGGPEDLVRPFYRNVWGQFIEIDSHGEAVPLAVHKNLCEEALEAFAELGRSLSSAGRRRGVSSATSFGVPFNGNPLGASAGFASPVAAAEPVAEQGLANPVDVPHAFAFRESESSHAERVRRLLDKYGPGRK